MSAWQAMLDALMGTSPPQPPSSPGRAHRAEDRALTVADVEGIEPADLQQLTGCSAEAAAARVAVARATGDWSHCLSKLSKREPRG